MQLCLGSPVQFLESQRDQTDATQTESCQHPSTNLSVLTYATPSGAASEHGNTDDVHEWLHINDLFQPTLQRGTVPQGMCLIALRAHVFCKLYQILCMDPL